MILRRITEHVKAQNWFAVWIDFLIVVVGVFIGLQVANWNDVRQARSEEQGYLERLRDDFSASISANENMIGFMSAQISNNNFAMEALKACELAPENRDRFAGALISIGKIIPTQLFDATIKELNATGKFQYIRSDQVRNAISRHLDAIEVEESIMRAIEQRAIPHTVYVESQIEYKVSEIGDLDGRPAWSRIGIDFDKLCQDHRFRRAISVNSLYLADVANRVQSNVDAQKEILALLEEDS